MTEQDADRMPATVREWTEILARIRFGTVKIAGKNVTGMRIKAVAGRLANYADGDGTRVRPGIARLAVDLETDYRGVGSIVAYLRALGLLQLVRAGRGYRADEYRLTLPLDLLDRDDLEVWNPARQTLEIERVRTARRGKQQTSGGRPKGPNGSRPHAPEGQAHDPAPHAPQGQAGNGAAPAPQGHAVNPDDGVPQGHAVPTETLPAPQGAKADSCACPTGTQNPVPACPTGTQVHAPQGHATFHDLDTRTTHHSGETSSVTVTVSRATASTPEPIAPVIDMFHRPQRPNPFRRTNHAQTAIAEAAARREAARAAHRAGAEEVS